MSPPLAIRLTVRSALDPQLAVTNITGGSMRLGAAPAEQLGRALAFLLLGGGLALPPLLAAGSAWGRRRRRIGRADDAATRIDEDGLAPVAPVVRAAGGRRQGGTPRVEDRTGDCMLPPRAANL